MRIAVAGFQHETNTFSPTKADYAAFEMADSWPGMLLGDAVISGTRGMNLPIAGAVAAVEDVDLVPVLWCAAEPSGPVADAAFDRITGMLLEGVAGADALDGIYLDLHGAMVTESHTDGEGEMLRRLRNLVGPELPIGVSLDLHANISPGFVRDATVVTVFRTYPHLDMAETGGRCLKHLVRAIEGHACVPAFRQAPILIPMHAQWTGAAPASELYDLVRTVSDDHVAFAELAMGFTASDVPDCGASVLAYGPDEDRAGSMADRILHALLSRAEGFDTRLMSPRDAIREARRVGSGAPVVLADVQDNPGGGGTSDTTGLLQALVEEGAESAILGVMCDPEVAARAHAEGEGAVFDCALGGKAEPRLSPPVCCAVRVLALSDGSVPYSGEMYRGGVATLGPSCLLRIETGESDLRVVVSSNRIQCLDQALFRHFGLAPEAAKVIGVKSTVHFRADFEAAAAKVLNVGAPGVCRCVVSLEDYENLRAGMRVA